VTGNTYRHPAVLAKMAVTVDHLSGGRLEFGIGAGWAEAEHQMYGIEGLDHRVGRLRESLEAMISLWTKARTTLQGRYYHFNNAIGNPQANPAAPPADLDRRRRGSDVIGRGALRG
jgi:alkanesulfonate monooxygenase SsuD/methylene tetrahydromethanopterin reductase-like flavin-dependent oxidoreductase (luciferase family)